MQYGVPNHLVNPYRGKGILPIWKDFVELFAFRGCWKAESDEKRDANLDARSIFGSRSTDLGVRPGQHEHSGEGGIGYYTLSNLGRAMLLRARILFVQGGDEEAKSEFLRAAEAFEKLGAT